MQISRTQNFGSAAKKLANGVTYRNSASNMGGGVKCWQPKSYAYFGVILYNIGYQRCAFLVCFNRWCKVTKKNLNFKKFFMKVIREVWTVMGNGDVKIFGLTDFPNVWISKKITQPLCLCVIFGCTSSSSKLIWLLCLVCTKIVHCLLLLFILNNFRLPHSESRTNYQLNSASTMTETWRSK